MEGDYQRLRGFDGAKSKSICALSQQQSWSLKLIGGTMQMICSINYQFCYMCKGQLLYWFFASFIILLLNAFVFFIKHVCIYIRCNNLFFGSCWTYHVMCSFLLCGKINQENLFF